jgi:hypothetical protein
LWDFVAHLIVSQSLAVGPWLYNITVQVFDQFGNKATQNVQVIVNPPPTSMPTTTSLPVTTTYALRSGKYMAFGFNKLQ